MIRVPDTWSFRRTRPLAEVCIATGWERESLELNADECREYAEQLLRAADKLDELEKAK